VGILRAHRFSAFREGLEALAHLGQRGARGVGELQSTIAALEELHAQVVLEGLHLVADGCGRYVQLRRCALEAQMPRRRFERPQRIERRQPHRHGARLE
jgi:hypothetical protein